MRILIIEDEHYAARRLETLILKELPEVTILGVIDSVEEAVAFLSSHVEPNLIFMDIQLADGLSLQIFDQIKINCPVIFVTAYDEYALNAFKVNGIDYLLKPIEEEDLCKAINKYQQFFPDERALQLNWQRISDDIFKPKSQYKQRFLIKSGNSYQYLNAADVIYFYSEDGLSFAIDNKQKKLILDNTLEKIGMQLDPDSFFKISRKHIVSIKNINKVHPYLNNRLKVELEPQIATDLVVSRDKVKDFKAWLDR